jgi:hypothetical protein
LLKGFMESGHLVVKLDLEGAQQSTVALRSMLTAYIKSHDLPVTVFQRDGDMYLARLDKEMLDDGTIQNVEDWRPTQASRGTGSGSQVDAEPTPISMAEVNKRYEEERSQATK